MKYTKRTSQSTTDIAELFETVFSASEGAEEGGLIGGLARRLIETTPPEDLFVFLAEADDTLTGAILFTRLTFGTPVSAFVLGPVAIATDRQGTGIGQRLISFGLDELKAAGVEIAFTYGDPRFYSRVGFEPISEEAFPAPYKLQMPEGWLGQPLTDTPPGPLPGPCACVPGFSDPAFW